MNRFSLSIAGAALAAFTAIPAMAATEPAAAPTPWEQKIEQLFAELDGNGDGVIDASEAEGEEGLARAFPRIAKNGTLDRQQFVDWYKLYDMPAAQE
jgi:hypothetical protein